MAICGNCGKEIAQGKQTVLWTSENGKLFFRFLCPECVEAHADELEEIDMDNVGPEGPVG